MRAFRILLFLALLFGLAACGPKSKFKKYHGPKVTEIQIHKGDRKMYLIGDGRVLRQYDVALGFAPVGHKEFEGDGKTPEGTYFMNYKNPNSEYHLSLMVSYPNNADRAYASSKGKSPGGDIFIHGAPNKKVYRRDWTAGCIAVTDKEMEEIYSMVNVGTPIHIFP
ncbi:L,D-transpeptidase family protein [Pseudogemmobacter sonorensis]|uniref:L,D-transpeptidase family protein n=1 Tax=Pseudogemmobacter sonorensis TaxID=2989681 RepID=UPI00367920D9